ncbi:MAG: XdhC family protein [Ktedonobacteraceae bacterium]|nr:XdhC family protein [Ktedonobacteraceae bacterium]
MPDMRSLLELEYRLMQAGKPFVVAIVVRCLRPASAKPGARAVVEADGRVTGWVGGSCTQPVVVREALRALQEGDNPYLLRLGIPGSEDVDAHREVRAFPMTCASGGALEIYMEPHLPQPLLVLVGDSPVGTALDRLASVLDFAVVHLNQADLQKVPVDQRTAIIVATHGEYDEDVLEQALRSPAAYVGMVGSRRRAEACRAYLRESGLEEQQIARLRAPAGLDIGALTPEEIAASILAELVQIRRQRRQLPATPVTAVSNEHTAVEEQHSTAQTIHETAVDPVCGMTVEIAGARHHVTYDGSEFYFCCPACKRLFERNPQEYLVRNER